MYCRFTLRRLLLVMAFICAVTAAVERGIRAVQYFKGYDYSCFHVDYEYGRWRVGTALRHPRSEPFFRHFVILALDVESKHEWILFAGSPAYPDVPDQPLFQNGDNSLVSYLPTPWQPLVTYDLNELTADKSAPMRSSYD